MAYRFNGTDQKISGSAAVVSAEPMTFSSWFNPDTITHGDFLVSQNKFDNGAGGTGEFFALSARGDQSGDLIWASHYNGTISANGVSASAFSAGVWQHAGAVFTSITSRTAYLNGAAGTTETTSIPAVFTLDRTTIASLNRSDNPGIYHDGDQAEAAIWNVSLTGDEMAALYKGFAAWPFVRSKNLVTYVPLNRSVRDYMQSTTFTAANSPTQLEHPLKILRPRPFVMGPTQLPGVPPPYIIQRAAIQRAAVY